MSLETISTILTVLGPASLVTFYLGTREFILQGKQKRAEILINKVHWYFTNSSFNIIRQLIEHDDINLQNYSFEEKRAYIAFFEEIALLTNSKLIKPDVAYYMFGYYAVKCLSSENFWRGFANKADIHWIIFMNFSKK